MTDAITTPWPRELPGLGRLRIVPFSPCADCAVGKAEPDAPHTWASYGRTPLCLLHVRARLAGRTPTPSPAVVAVDPGW